MNSHIRLYLYNIYKILLVHRDICQHNRKHLVPRERNGGKKYLESETCRENILFKETLKREKPVGKEEEVGWLSRMRVKEYQRLPLSKMIDREYGVYKKDVGELKNHNTEIPCTV